MKKVIVLGGDGYFGSVLVKQLLKEGVYQKVIAKQFNVTSGTISHLNLNKTYKNVQELE